MSTYDERIAALEKDAVITKKDITYKLDDTNSAVTIFKGDSRDAGSRCQGDKEPDENNGHST